MKLLFDENLSPRLARLLADVYPESSHVHELGFGANSDTLIWRFAAEHGWIIVSKDSDFADRGLTFGAPPKIIWVRLGNCRTEDVEALLRQAFPSISDFNADPDLAVLGLPLQLIP